MVVPLPPPCPPLANPSFRIPSATLPPSLPRPPPGISTRSAIHPPLLHLHPRSRRGPTRPIAAAYRVCGAFIGQYTRTRGPARAAMPPPAAASATWHALLGAFVSMATARCRSDAAATAGGVGGGRGQAHHKRNLERMTLRTTSKENRTEKMKDKHTNSITHWTMPAACKTDGASPTGCKVPCS